MERCELDIFSDAVQTIFRAAIERLYYSTRLKIGDAILPQAKIRSYLQLLTADVLVSVLDCMQRNSEPIKNKTGYLMSLIINTIFEQESELILCMPPGNGKEGENIAFE